MARKRANGDGSVTFDKTAGTWVARVTLGYRSDGRPIRKKFTAKTQREANDRMKAALKATGRGLELPDEKLTTGKWLAKWLETLPDRGVSRGTEDTYRRAVRLWVDPAVGHVPLQKLRPDDVRAMLRSLASKGLSGETQRMARAVLRRALRCAEQDGVVARNVAALADGPRIERDERRALSRDQAGKLLRAATKDRLGAAILLEVAVGLRRGETLGLGWADLALEGTPATAAINRQLQRLPRQSAPPGGPLTELTLTELKTRKSRRTVILPEFVVVALRKQRAAQAADRLAAGERWAGEDGLVFTTPLGRPVDPRNFNRVLSRVAVAAGLGHWSPHELRHSAVTLLLEAGVPLSTISEVVGHSSIRVTKDVYGHLVDAQRQSAADAMRDLLGDAPPPEEGTGDPETEAG